MATSGETTVRSTTVDPARTGGGHRRRIVLGALIVGLVLGWSPSLADDGGSRATRIAFQQPSKEPAPKPGSAVEQRTVATPGEAAGKNVAPLPFKPITSVGPRVEPASGLLPPDSSTAYFSSVPAETAAVARPWDHVEYSWVGTGLCYRPLYFQEWELERRGNTVGLAQPALSSAQFFGRAIALPGLMVMRPPRQFVCTRDPSGGSIWSPYGTATDTVVVPSAPEPAQPAEKPSPASAP